MLVGTFAFVHGVPPKLAVSQRSLGGLVQGDGTTIYGLTNPYAPTCMVAINHCLHQLFIRPVYEESTVGP